jgi:hypothetical protein
MVPLFRLTPGLLGWPDPAPTRAVWWPVYGYQETIWFLTTVPVVALLNSLLGAFLFATIRRWLGALAGRTSQRWIGSLWLVAILGIACAVLLDKSSGIDATYPLLDLAFTAVMMLGMAVVIFRFGLLATIVASFVVGIANLPFTLDPSKIYAGPSWLAMAVVTALAIVGFWLARAGEPLFGTGAEDRVA